LQLAASFARPEPDPIVNNDGDDDVQLEQESILFNHFSGETFLNISNLRQVSKFNP
jgi:hypothetical protein